jgi:hypothetical protein
MQTCQLEVGANSVSLCMVDPAFLKVDPVMVVTLGSTEVVNNISFPMHCSYCFF